MYLYTYIPIYIYTHIPIYIYMHSLCTYIFFCVYIHIYSTISGTRGWSAASLGSRGVEAICIAMNATNFPPYPYPLSRYSAAPENPLRVSTPDAGQPDATIGSQPASVLDIMKLIF